MTPDSANLLLLHGIACTRRVWDSLLPALSRHFKVYAPDLRFHGLNRAPSGVPADASGCTMQDYASDLVARLEPARFHPTWILGHSMGARVAVATARVRPEWVEGLVLVDHPLAASPATREFRTQFRNFLETLPESFASFGEAERYLRERCPDPSSLPLFAASLRELPEGGLGWDFDAARVLETFDAIPAYPYADGLHELADRGIPVLVLRGGQSRFWTGQDWQDSRAAFARHVSVEFQEIAMAGHGLPLETPKAFLAAVSSFILRDPTSGAPGQNADPALVREEGELLDRIPSEPLK